MTKKTENPGDIQEIFKVKKSRRWFQKNQKSKRFPGGGNPVIASVCSIAVCI